MIIQKARNNTCSTYYQFNMWYKGGWMFCCGVEEEKVAEEDDTDIDPDYEDDINDDDDEQFYRSDYNDDNGN